MPEYTDHERAQLHAKARQQIRFVTLAPTMEAASNRRFLALGYLLALTETGALTPPGAELLRDELQIAVSGQIDDLFQQTLLDTLPPQDAVHCPGHVDYDPASRKPEAKP
jgi:hypothetical protein